MTDFREGPPRIFVPVSSKGPHGYTFHGPMGYEEIAADDVGECPVEVRTDEPEKAREGA
uniref:Uncharacterized protein n=1 Tax=viral metagenome TaxID=1070528 RepID=A0A6M3L324_9ZZZZ